MGDHQTRPLTGGCQCGAVRFAVAKAGRSGICHCRMCQKAVGNFFAALVEVEWSEMSWTRGTPASWHSSEGVRRLFCASCGTPLAYAHDGGIELTTGAFDDPENVPPRHQTNHSVRLSFCDRLADLKPDDESEYASYQRSVVSLQHPDQDTDNWQPA